jgi:hypothetical protein
MFCPSCKTYRLKLVDSHKSFQSLSEDIQRRQYRCPCRYAKTVYVVPQELLQEYKELKSKAEQIVRLLTDSTQTLKDCSSCSFWDHNAVKCDLGLPEAGGTFAEECSSYLDKNGGHL